MCCALLLSLAGSASAAPAADKIFAATPAGLTEPNGIAVTPDGQLWASDALLGLCRVDIAGKTVVRDEFCAPEPPAPAPLPDGTEPPAPEPTRPAATFQIVFDATGCDRDTSPADKSLCNFYVAEGASNSSGVWRMHWNSQTGAIDAATRIYIDASRQRVQGVALTPDRSVLFSSKKNNDIERIDDPASADPSFPQRVITTTADVTALAYLGGELYIAEGGRLSRADGVNTATLLTDPADGAVVNSLLADEASHTLFVGTSRPQNTDAVLSYRPGTGFLPGAYDRGFANVTSMTLGLDGQMFIAHDPTAALSLGVDAPGQGEVWERARTAPNPPGVRFTKHPAAFLRSGSVDFAFEATDASGPAAFECTLDDNDPVDCSDGTFSVAGPSETAHRLTVRAATAVSPVDADYGVTETAAFTIDDTNPVVEIDPRTSHTAVGGSLRLLFSADERNPVAFKCKVDDGQLFGCGSPQDLVLPLGAHTVTVTATDAAGNASAPVTWDVTAVPAPRIPVVPAPTPVTTPAPAATIGATGTTGTAAAPALTPVTKGEARIDINVPCVAVSASRRERAEFALRGRSARIDYRAPAKARYAKFTLRRASGGRRGGAVVETLGYARMSRGGLHRSSIALTAGQRRRVRAGAMRLAVAYGTCRTQVGRWQWITGRTDSNTAREGQR